MIISGGIKDAIVGWLREQHLPFRIQEASRGVCTGKPQESKMILMDNYPPGFSFRARQQAPVKRTPVKSQAGRQPHLWIHCISRMTVISISHRDMAKKMCHASLGITQSVPGSELWFSPGGKHIGVLPFTCRCCVLGEVTFWYTDITSFRKGIVDFIRFTAMCLSVASVSPGPLHVVFNNLPRRGSELATREIPAGAAPALTFLAFVKKCV